MTTPRITRPPDPAEITGLVLAGGRGLRMGGVDKGLQPFDGVPLALRALRRLAPQVGRVVINANRNLDAYAAMGAPVWPDALPDHPGPLAGLLAGLARAETPYLVCVPCDVPHFPDDLVARLAAALAEADAQIAMAATREHGTLRKQPVLCLLKTELRQSLTRFMQTGERKVGLWAAGHRLVTVPFEAAAFVNVNTLAELQQLQDERS